MRSALGRGLDRTGRAVAAAAAVRVPPGLTAVPVKGVADDAAAGEKAKLALAPAKKGGEAG